MVINAEALDINKILSEYRNKYSVIKRFNNSYSSLVYKVRGDEGIFVLKVSGSAEAFKSEMNMLSFLDQHSFNSPKLIEFYEGSQHNSMIMSYLDGDSCENKIDFTNINELVDTIIAFHNLSPLYSLTHWDLRKIVKTFKNDLKILDSYLNNICMLDKHFDENLHLIINRTFGNTIHRDLRMGNIILNSDAMWLIDFESCAIGDNLMDIVKIVDELRLKDIKLSELFLGIYAEKSNNQCLSNIKQILEFYKFIDKVSSMVWCIRHDRIGSDYWIESKKYIMNI